VRDPAFQDDRSGFQDDRSGFQDDRSVGTDGLISFSRRC